MRKKSLTRRITAATLSIILLSSCTINASAWKGSTHVVIVDEAIDILKNDNKTAVYDFYQIYENALKVYCKRPDADNDIDKGGTFEGAHYYNVRDKDGNTLASSSVGAYYKNRDGNYAKSARTMFEENYTMAVCQYRSGYYAQAMESLGRATHMLSDIGCTPHTTSLKTSAIFSSIHSKFEEEVLDYQEYASYHATNSTQDLYVAYSRKSLADAINNLAKYSGSLSNQKIIKTLDDDISNTSGIKSVVKNTLSYTEQNVAAMLCNFYADVKYTPTDNNFIVDGGIYYIKNRKSGK